MAQRIVRIDLADRPYVLTFHASGLTYRMTADDARRLVAGNAVTFATRNRITLQPDGHFGATLRPATVGGGSAFHVVREVAR